MNNYLQNQYRETKLKFDKFSSRLQRKQETGEFHKMTKSKQNFLVQRVKRLWEKLQILEIRLKTASVGAVLACMMMVTNLSAQDQFVPAPDKNPLPPPSTFVLSPMLVDIDSDGDLDLLGSEDYMGLDLFMNVGSATAPEFEKVSDENDPFAGIEGVHGLRIYDIMDSGDIDGDGDIDFLTDNNTIIKNIGSNAALEFKEEAYAGSWPYNSSLGDIDGDGDLDIIERLYSNNIIVYQNIGDAGNFNLYTDTTVKIPVANWDENISQVDYLYPLDIDADGDLDFLADLDIYEYGQGERKEVTKFIRNIGSSTNPVFTLEEDANNPYRDFRENQPTFGDLDGDGDIDVLFCDLYETGGLRYFETEDNSITENTTQFPEFSDGIILPASLFPLQFVDYDGDGDFDLFNWKYYSEYENIGYFEYIETGQAIKYIERLDNSFAFMEEGIDYQYPVFVDLDLDGDNDIIMLKEDGTYSFGWIYEYLENSGTDADPVYETKLFSALTEAGDFSLPTFVDIDSDGDLDMFFIVEDDGAYNYGLATKFYESTGEDPLEFTERTGADNPLDLLTETNFEDIMYYGRPVFSDIDGDGDMDVLFAGYEGIYYLENTGTATEPAFVDKTSESPFSTIERESLAISLNLIDLDGDGDDDLFIQELYGMVTKYYENTLLTGNEIHDAPSVEGISIFPNPASNEISVRLEELVYGSLEFEVISIEGKVLLNGKVKNRDNAEKFEINTSSLVSGYYILKVKSNQKYYMTKFLIE